MCNKVRHINNFTNDKTTQTKRYKKICSSRYYPSVIIPNNLSTPCRCEKIRAIPTKGSCPRNYLDIARFSILFMVDKLHSNRLYCTLSRNLHCIPQSNHIQYIPILHSKIYTHLLSFGIFSLSHHLCMHTGII